MERPEDGPASYDRHVPETAPRPPTVPPLAVAASLAAVQGLLLLGYGIAEAATLSGDRLVMGSTTAVFFASFGVLLIVAAWGLTRGWTLARGPVLFAQLVQLGLAWNFRGGDTTVVAVVLAVVALVVLVGLLHPASLAALDDDPEA